MATKYNLAEAFMANPQAETLLEQARDSFCLLSVLNQFTFTTEKADLEMVLRFALFDPSPTTVAMRQRLAATLRRQRRRGVVQVMITLFWFVVVLIISIQRAFGDLGGNATAHDLALGLLLGWLAVLIASTIVDRNPTDTEHSKRKLNSFLLEVQRNNPSEFPHFDPAASTEVFQHFAGQGRRRWHYGAAHCILEALEDDYLKARGREWIELYVDGTLSRLPLGKGGRPATHGLWYFSIRQLWYACFSWLLLVAACLGAFWISYNTPTVGLGCRSGGYMIFGILTTFSLLLELASWPFINRINNKCKVALDLFLIVVETVSMAWLAYIITAQTFGIYNSCKCKSSLWGGSGGYLDFESMGFYNEYFGIKLHWITGTIIGMLSLGVGFGYIVESWLTQSHLWSADWENAKRGLVRTRRWRKYTMWPRRAWRWILDVGRNVERRFGYMVIGEGRSVRWQPH
jgi:hypothetical protein